MRSHKTMTMIIDGEAAEIDINVAPLVKVMNSIPGLTTLNSCENAYVHFKDCTTEPVSVRFLQGMLVLLAPVAAHLQKKEERYVTKFGWRFGTKGYPMRFSVEIGNDYCIRCSPDDLPHVLKAARKVAKQLRDSAAMKA